MRIITSSAVYALGAVLVMGATQAHAQDQVPAQDQAPRAAPSPDEAATVDEVVVTGSRITRRDNTAQSPIMTVAQDEILSRGAPTLETTLNQLPQFTPSAGAASSFNSRGGQANLNLRALGAQRTLVLIDGRRLQPANADGSADLNVLPTALIESVETITGGASAVYGSDAIAGVVNVKLKRRFEGLELAGQASRTVDGDAGARELSLTGGRNFLGDRLNVTLAGVYSERDAVSFRDRSFLDDQALSANLPNGAWIVNAANLPSQAAVNSIFARYGAAAGSVSRSTQFGFNDNGSVFRPAGALGYTGVIGGKTTSFSNTLYSDTGYYNLAQVPLERYTAYGRMDYEAGASVRLFAQGLFTHYTADTAGPPPNSSSITNPLTVPVANPFISADLRALLASRAAPNDPFVITKRFDTLGARTERDDYDVYQVVVGGEGDVGVRDLSWNAYASVGETRYTATEINYPSISAVQTLLSAPDGGASLCAGGFNPFGDLTASPQCQAYIARTAESTTSLKQAVVEATVTGSVFDLPAGPLSFALGADYRRTEYDFQPDALIAAGDLANFLPTSQSGGTIDATEVFGELLVPLLADVPFARSLNLDLGYRYSDYNIAGGIDTYKAGFDWRPVDALMIRGGYARATRAPSAADLFSAVTVDFATLGTLGPIGGGDPCDVRSGYRAAGYAGAAQVRQLCLAQGVPSNLVDTFQNTSTRSRTTTVGNTDLQPETADTYSIGAVFTPRLANPLLAGISLSVDYYSIEIEQAVGNITAPLAVQRCFNADGSNPTYDQANVYCQLITREAGRGLIGNISTPKLNLGGYKTTGVDVAAAWPIPLDALGIRGGGVVTLATDVGYLASFEIQTLPGGPFLDYAGTIQNTQVDLFTSARPEWKAATSIRYADDSLDLGLRWRHIGAMDHSANIGVAGGSLPETPSVDYFDLDFGVKLNDRVEFRGGVTNLTDKEPPISVPTPVGAYTVDLNTYDIIGRQIFVGFKARF